MKIYSELEEVQLQSLATGSESALRTARVGGIWWNTTLTKCRVSDGTLIRSLLRNDQVCVFGNSATAADNIRFQRGGAELFQFLLGSDSTAEGTASNSIAQIDARLRNWTTGTRPSSASTNKGRVGFNTSTNEIEIDNGTEIVNIGTGGGSLVITDITAGENIPAGGAPVYIAERDYITISSTTNTIPFRKSAVNYPATLTSGTYLFDTQQNIDTFVAMVQAAVTAAAIVGSTVTVTFSQSTRKFTFTGTTSVDIMWNSQTTNSAAATLGFATDGDDSGTTHTADNEIDDTGTGLAQKAFMFQCHADFLHTSYSYAGFANEAIAQYATGSIYKGEVTTSAHNDGLSLGDLYVAKAAITFDATNNDIDFNDGSDRAVSITAGTYTYPYDSLCTDIKTVMDASASSLTFTVTYSTVTDKFTIVGSSAFTLEWATGANTATGAHTKLGWTVADTASATTQTSVNAVQQKGRIVSDTSTDLGQYSRKVGFAVEQDRIFAQLDTYTQYTGMLTVPNDWLATPLEKDFSADGMGGSQHENANGYGVRILTPSDGTSAYKIQYKNGHGAAWLDASTTTIAVGDNAAGALTENYGGEYRGIPKVFVDENNKAVMAIIVWNNGDGEFRVYAYYSNDLSTWTKATGPGTDSAIVTSGTQDFFVGDLYIRQSKAVILVQNDANNSSTISICDDSGSGYVNWTNTALSGTINYAFAHPSFVRIQYFSAETGVNKYRIVMCGISTDNTRAQISYTKGDGSSLAEISEANTFAAANTHYMISAAMDSVGDGNTIIFTGQNNSSAVIYRCLTNAAYNSGTLTTNNFSSATINPNGATQMDILNGYTSGAASNLMLNQGLRSIVLGSKHYHLFCLNAGRELYISYSIDSGTSYSALTLHNGSTTQLVFEYCMFYVSSINKIVVAYKFSDATADNLTEGKIYAALINLSGTGVPSLEVGFTQIDGGQAGTVFNGFLTGSASTNAVNISWEHYNGSRDVLWSNKFI